VDSIFDVFVKFSKSTKKDLIVSKLLGVSIQELISW